MVGVHGICCRLCRVEGFKEYGARDKRLPSCCQAIDDLENVLHVVSALHFPRSSDPGALETGALADPRACLTIRY